MLSLGVVWWIIFLIGLVGSFYWGYSRPEFRPWGGFLVWIVVLLVILAWSEWGNPVGGNGMHGARGALSSLTSMVSLP